MEAIEVGIVDVVQGDDAVTQAPVRGSLAAGPIALGGIAICLLVIAGLWVVARDAPSSEVGLVERLALPSIDGDEGCANFADYWMNESGAKMEAEVLQRFTNCVRDEDGTWTISSSMFAATRLDEESLSDDQRAQLAGLRATIDEQDAGLDAALSDSLSESLRKIHARDARAVIGHLVEGAQIGSVRTRYARVINAYMLDPKNRELAEFVGWTMARKIDAFAEFRRACLGNANVAYLHDACRGMEDSLNIRYAPFPWDLTDPALIDTYFNETVVMPAAEEAE